MEIGKKKLNSETVNESQVYKAGLVLNLVCRAGNQEVGLLVVAALRALFWGPKHFVKSYLTLCQAFSLCKGKGTIPGSGGREKVCREREGSWPRNIAKI